MSNPAQPASAGALSWLSRLSRDSFYYGFSDALARLLGLLTAPILTRIFVPADYGVLNLLQTAVGLFVILAGMNLSSGTYYYYYEAKAREVQDTALSTAFWFTLALSVAFSAFTWLAAPAIARVLVSTESGTVTAYDYTGYIRILSIGMFFMLMDSNFRSYLRMTRQPLRFLRLSILQVLLSLAAVLYLVVYRNLGIEGALWSSVFAFAITSALGLYYVFERYRWCFDPRMFLSIFAYAFPMIPGIIFNWGLFQSNRLFLNYYAGLTELGFYSIATQVASAILIVVTGFRMAYDPFALSIMKEPDAARTYARVYTLYSVGFAVAGACFALFAKEILQIITPPQYHAAYALVPVLVLSFVIQGANNILAAGIWLSKRTIFTSYATIIAFVVNTALNFAMIPAFGALGAAGALALGLAGQSVAYYVFGRWLYPVPFGFWRQQVLLLTLFGLLYVHVHLVAQTDLLATTARSILFVPLVILAGWLIGLSPEERGTALRFLQNGLARWRSPK